MFQSFMISSQIQTKTKLEMNDIYEVSKHPSTSDIMGPIKSNKIKNQMP